MLRVVICCPLHCRVDPAADSVGAIIVAMLKPRPSGPARVAYESGLTNADQLGWTRYENWTEHATTSLLNSMIGEDAMCCVDHSTGVCVESTILSSVQTQTMNHGQEVALKQC